MDILGDTPTATGTALFVLLLIGAGLAYWVESDLIPLVRRALARRRALRELADMHLRGRP